MGQVLSVNVGTPRDIQWDGQLRKTSIWKQPVSGRVAVRGVNVAGDDQADRRAHGGPDKAVYAYAREDAAWWEAQLGRPLEPGAFGENLTLEGIEASNATVGEQWEVGTALLQVTQPRIPCWKLGVRMGDPAFPAKFSAAGRHGAYLRILREGEVGAGDAVRVVDRPAHGLTVRDAAHIYLREHARLAELLRAPELSAGWRVWVEERLAARRPAGTAPE